MSPNLRSQFSDLFARLLVILWLPAAGTSVLNYSAYTEFLAPYGFGWWGLFLAATCAVVVGAIYWLFYAFLLGVVAFLPKSDRAKLTALILLMTAFVLAASSYPNVQVMAGGYAADIEDRAYVEEAATKADLIKAGVRQFDQLSGILAQGGKALRDLEARERRGLLSGFESDNARPGPVSDWVGAQGARFEALAAQIAPAQRKATAIIERIEAASKAMREALDDRELDQAARRSAMQSQGDAFRSAVIELRETLPLAAMQSFALSLQEPPVSPALSGKENIQAGQLRAIATVEQALKRQGKQLEGYLSTLKVNETEAVAAYAPAPSSVLVVKHAWQLGNIIAAALAIDLLPLALYFIIARVNDAMRRTRLQDDDLESMSVGDLVRAIRAEQHLKAKRGRADYGVIEGPYGRYLKNGGEEGRQ